MQSFESDFLIDQLSQGFLKLDQNLTIMYANAALFSMMDASPDDLYGLTLSKLTARSGILFDSDSLHEQKVHVLCLYSFSGKRLFLEFSFSPVVNREAEFTGYAVLVRDVTGKTLKMEKLQTGIEAYRDIASSGADWFWETDSSGTFTFVGGKVTDFTGYTPEEVFGRTPFQFMSEEEARRVAYLFSRLAAKDMGFSNLLNESITKAGEKRVVSTSGVSVLDREGNLKGYRGSNRDVTREVESRRRLRRTLEETIEVLNELPVGVVVTDGDFKILQANKAACAIVDLKPKEVAGRKNSEVFCTGCKQECQMSYRSGRTVYCRFNLAGKNGNSTPVLKTVAPVPSSSGQRYLHVIADISQIHDEIHELLASNHTLQQRIRAESDFSHSREAALSGKRDLHWSIFQEAIDALGGIAGHIDTLSASEWNGKVFQLLNYHICVLTDALDSMRNQHDPSFSQFSLEEEDFFVSSFLERNLAQFRISAAGEGIKLKTEYSDSQNMLFKGPVRGMRTILSKLLTLVVPSSDVFLGACETGDDEHSPAFRISLSVSPQEAGISKDSPQGQPILDENHSTLLECRKYTALLGCELFTEELKNGGIHIWADFPVVPAVRGDISVQPEKIGMIVFSDDPAQAELFAAMSEKAGHRTVRATDLEFLKAGFSSYGIDDHENVCLLIDSDSPLFSRSQTIAAEGNGFSRTGETRWILTASRVRTGDVGYFSSRGYSALLLKPLRLGRLKKCISRVFSIPSGSSFTTDYSL